MPLFLGNNAVTFYLGTTAITPYLGSVPLITDIPPVIAGLVNTGINLSGLNYWTEEFPFNNLLRKAGRWRSQQTGEPWSENYPMPPMSEDGYPLSLADGFHIETIVTDNLDDLNLTGPLHLYVDGDDSYDDNFWEGNIRASWPAQMTKVEDGHYTINPNGATTLTIRIVRTRPEDPLRNIRILINDNDDLFRPEFLARQEGMKVLRFMDYMVTNNSPIVDWADYPKITSFPSDSDGYDRVPIEILCALSNETNIAPWFNVPHLATDAFVIELARKITENLTANVPVYIEYSNECWNSMFEQYVYCNEQGNALGLPGDNQWERGAQFYGLRTKQIEEILRPIFGSRLKMVYAWQAVNPYFGSLGLEYDDVGDHVDVCAIAPYFGSSLGDFDYPPGNPHSQQVKDGGLPFVFSYLENNIDTVLRQAVSDWNDLATTHNTELWCYEAGQHLVGTGPAVDDAELRNIFQAANRDPRMGNMYKLFVNMWNEETPEGSLIAWYHSMSSMGHAGAWGLMENENDYDNVKWTAVQETLDTSDPNYSTFPPYGEIPSSDGVGGVAFGTMGQSGTIYENYRMVDGDDFDNTTAADFVSPTNGSGRYMTTRHYGVQSGAPRYLRGAASLGGYEADPWHTGYADANRGTVPASYSDLITFGDGTLKTKTRRATTSERAIMGPLNGKNNLSAMVHMGRRNMLRAPCIMEMRLRFPHALSNWNQYHPTFWLLQSQPGNGWDGLEIDCEGFTPELGLYRNTWNGGTLVNTANLGYTQAVSQTEYRTYTFKIDQDSEGVWMMYLYEDGVLRGSGTCSSGTFTFNPNRPFHLMQTSHILQNGLTQSVFDNAGATGATMDCDYWRVWQPGASTFRKPLLGHEEYNADFGTPFSFSLPTPQQVWGSDITTDVIENIPHEDNTPGAPWQRGLLPASITRTGNTLAGTFNDFAGRLILARSVTPQSGDGCIPQTITINIGPQIRTNNIQYQVGVAGSFDLYAACDCGDLHIGKQVTVTGLPAWATYNASTGLITWTNPPDVASINLTVTVTNSNGQSRTATVALAKQVTISGFIYDTFTAADGTRLGDHVGEDNVGWRAPGNINGNGGIINNNRVSPMTNNVMIYRKQIDPPSNDYEVTGVIDKLTTISGESTGILLRNSGEGEQGYLCRTNGTSWAILRMTSTGASTALGSAYTDNIGNGTSRTFRFRVVGNTLTLFINDVAVITTTDPTNAFPTGRVGVRMIPPRTATTGMHLTSIEARVVS